MTTKKYRQKMIKHYTCLSTRAIACISFLVLTIIGVSSLVRAMSLENIRNENGIPAVWETASLGNPETITVPITYWDQRQDDCEDQNRQFEWTICQYWTAGALQGVVKDQLGKDGLPVPAYTNSTDAWAANHDIFTANATGQDPVQSSDNFYRWFHDTDKSQHFNREITFQRIGNSNSYTYGGQNIFPLDDVNFSKSDSASESGNSDDRKQHNFHFTAHLSIPVKIAADGSELFEFSGDDDVWVFLNGHLVLDIGGLHEALNGNFRINADGTVTSYVQNVNDVSDRAKLGKPGVWAYNYINKLNEHNRSTYADQTKTFDIGLEAGDVVNLDFFYAERSTTASNTKITISNMNWPISADSNVDAKIVGKVSESDSNLVQFNTSIKNRDPENPLDLERLSAYIVETTTDQKPNDPDNAKVETKAGFLALDSSTLSYTTTPNDADSWRPVEISAPADSTSGFNLAQPITITPSGQTGDTVYFRYFAETSNLAGEMTNQTSYYTSLNGASGVTYDYDTVKYKASINYHSLKINYLYEDGTPAAEPYLDYFYPDATYEVASPEITDFTPDIALVKGTIGHEDVEYTVYYKKNEEPAPISHKVVVKYVYEDGTTAAESYSAELPEGSEYNIHSPTIEGYLPDQESVTGAIIDQDVEIIVTYIRQILPHKLTINYLYEDGTLAAEAYQAELFEDEDYFVKSPEIEGYEADQPTVGGKIGREDIEYTVTYSKITPPNPDQPTDPDVPPEPVTPDVPETPPADDPAPSDGLPTLYPPSDTIDGDLLYLAPLGAVAYVPNTGVVSSIVNPIFDEYFADVILSQGFILGMLAIFASSFAVFFSLRRFLVLAPAARNTNTRTSKQPRKSTVSASKTRKTVTTSKTNRKMSNGSTARMNQKRKN